MVCADADDIPKTAPAAANAIPTERKDPTEKYMMTLSRIPYPSKQAERAGKVPRIALWGNVKRNGTKSQGKRYAIV